MEAQPASEEASGPRLDVALVHYPVVNKNGETIGSAVTNLDLHDLARAGRTFGVDTLYIVTPFADQQELAEEILAHWTSGHGAVYNEKRKEALARVRVVGTLSEVLAEAEARWGKRPTVLATCARRQIGTIAYSRVRERLTTGEPMLLLFGTAWGLASEVFTGVDGTLPPIEGAGAYNHLSVRAAAAITLDRLLGERGDS